MSEFWTLFKYEMKKQFPVFSKRNKLDIPSFVLSSFFTIAIILICGFLMSIIAKNYLQVRVDKIFDNTARAYELLNVLYNLVIIVLTFFCFEKMRKSFTDKTDKKIFLRLPIKQQNLFLSKLAVLLLNNYITAFLLIVPINIIVFIALKPSAIFWFTTVVVWLLLPIVVMLFVGIFIVPYIKLIEFLKTRYVLMFAMLTLILVGLFYVYSILLGVIQNYLETGLIKFLFNEKFLDTMQLLLKITYPANCFAGIMVGKDLLKSCLVILLYMLAAVVVTYFVTKRLYHVALYRDEAKKAVYKNKTSVKKLSPILAMIKKEFVSVFREPNHMFSYFVIAAGMPVMVYCCYTLFESLIYNMLSFKFTFELALLIILVFSVLTNTFCATNVTREGKAILKQKTLPITSTQFLDAKVIFCSIVSIFSVVLTSTVLIVVTELSVLSGLVCMLIGSLFSVAQIFIATKYDLKTAKITTSSVEIEKQTSRTIARVVTLGLILALVVGVGCVLLGVLAKGIMGASVHVCFVYIIPSVLGMLYFGFAFWYYKKGSQKALDRVVV